MASRQDGVTQLYDLPQGGGPERLPQPEKTKDKVLLDERGLLDLPFLALTVLLVLIGADRLTALPVGLWAALPSALLGLLLWTVWRPRR